MDAFSRRRQRLLRGVWLVVVCSAGALAAAQDVPELRLPPDVTYSKAEGSPGPVVFSHATHVAFADNKCTVCHPATFLILQPTRRITHAEMTAGKQCGACHDGIKASEAQDNCSHCHTMEGGS